MGCLDNIVSIRNSCTAVTSNSGLYLDQIDVTLREVNEYVTRDFPNGSALVEDKISFASREVAATINAHFAGRYRATSVIDSKRIGFNLDNKETVAASAVMKGQHIEICRNDSYVELHLSQLELFVNFTGDVDVNVYDLIQGKLIDTVTVAAVAGEVVSVDVNKTYKAKRKNMDLFIGYDATNIASYKTEILAGTCRSCGSGSLTSLNSYLRARGASISIAGSKINSNIVGESFTGGLSLVYSVACDHESWLCSVQNVIALPVMYLTAANLMRFALDYSDQFNTTTHIDRPQLERRHNYYLQKYNETLGQALSNMRVPSDSLCFECNDRVKTVVNLP